MNTTIADFDLIMAIQKCINLLENQEDLDVDFKRILIDNLWDLYEEEKDAINI